MTLIQVHQLVEKSGRRVDESDTRGERSRLAFALMWKLPADWMSWPQGPDVCVELRTAAEALPSQYFYTHINPRPTDLRHS